MRRGIWWENCHETFEFETKEIFAPILSASPSETLLMSWNFPFWTNYSPLSSWDALNRNILQLFLLFAAILYTCTQSEIISVKKKFCCETTADRQPLTHARWVSEIVMGREGKVRNSWGAIIEAKMRNGERKTIPETCKANASEEGE